VPGLVVGFIDRLGIALSIARFAVLCRLPGHFRRGGGSPLEGELPGACFAIVVGHVGLLILAERIHDDLDAAVLLVAKPLVELLPLFEGGVVGDDEGWVEPAIGNLASNGCR
jgi:hypothetical protein